MKIIHTNYFSASDYLKITIFSLIVLTSCFGFSQSNAINYKAIIKDAGGNLLQNSVIIVEFTILQGLAMTTIYRESHTPNTDSNGAIVLNIGEGTALNGDFNTIAWGSDSHFINTRIDIGSGFVDMGTEEFRAVPYALQAQNVKNKSFNTTDGIISNVEQTNNFVVGSTQLDDIVSDTNDDSRMFFNKNKAAFRAGYVDHEWNDIDIGQFSSALGSYTTASGSNSTAIGLGTIASGLASFSAGESSDATGLRSLAMGNNSIASGDYSTATGNGSIASNNNTISMGFGSEASGHTSTAMGLYTLASGIHSTAMGSTTEASGNRSTAMGLLTDASGSNSTAMGSQTDASGSNSTAMGLFTLASGNNSTAMGSSTLASGIYSTTMGYITKAEAYATTAIGRNNIGGGSADDWIETDPLFEIGNGEAIGVNKSNAFTVLKNGKVGIGEHQPNGFLEVKATNTPSQPNINLIDESANGARINFSNTDTTNGNVWTLYGDTNDTDANSIFNLFHTNAGNILEVRGDGQVGINGEPDTEFHVYHDTSSSSTGFKLENTDTNANWWRIYTANSTGGLLLYSKNQGTTSVGNFDNVTGAYSATSDRRLKKDFKTLPFNWNNFMNLETLSYRYKAQKNDKRSLGLIAQDVQLIYPELVNYNTEDDVYHLNYSGFGVVAIKAIQELKSEMEQLKNENKALKKQLSKFETLEARLLALESKTESFVSKSTDLSEEK